MHLARGGGGELLAPKKVQLRHRHPADAVYLEGDDNHT
jgi:hypothetical protein